MSEPVMRMLSALKPFGVRPCGAGWIARCPAHDDRHASLCIGEGEGGRVLLCCHGGCAVGEIVRVLGLAMRDLFAAPSHGKDGRTLYDYRDEKGNLLFQVVRIPQAVGKRFVQRRPNGCGGWIWNVAGVRHVLYRLPALLAADPSEVVFLVEGEKDADNLTRWGCVGTTNPGGAGKWRREYAEALLGRHVIILPDNDDPGRRHAADIVRSLAGVAASVKVIELPGLRLHGDVSDWIAAGGTSAELRRLAAMAGTVREGRLRPQRMTRPGEPATQCRRDP